MSVPFSNTHLRVPLGFGVLLEGLAREVLRDQPEDIPKYAADYFNTLLEQRGDAGLDTAEWAAKLEDGFYNSREVKQANPENKPVKEAGVSKEKSCESQTEDESSQSADAPNITSLQLDISEEANVEEEKLNTTDTISEEQELVQEESVDRLPVAHVASDELSGTEKEKDPPISDQAAIEKDNTSVPDQDKPQSDAEPADLLSFSGKVSVDVCAQGLGNVEEDRDEAFQGTVEDDVENGDSGGEENTEAEEPIKALPDSGLTNVNLCATELGQTEGTMGEARDDGEAHTVNEESSKPQSEDAVPQPYLSQFETPSNQQETEVEAEKTREEKGAGTEASFGETHDILAYGEGVLDCSDIPEEDSLVEISFEEIPTAQQIAEVGERQPEEVLHSEISEMQRDEKSSEVAAAVIDQNTSATQDHDKPEKDAAEEGFNSKSEAKESQEEASDRVDADGSDLNDGEEDDEMSDAVLEEAGDTPSQSADADRQAEARPFGSEQEMSEPEGERSDKQDECSRPQEEEDIMDIPLDDPEANRAAAKIQAGFRGHMTRKKMKPEDKAEGEEVSSTGDVLNGSKGDTETGGSGAVENDDTSVPEQ